MTSLLDTLTPANPPEAKGAKLVRPMGNARDDEADIEAQKSAAPTAASKEPPKMNNKSASIRTLLSMHPDGLGYEDISRHTGIARDAVGKFVAALMTTGDIKPFEFPDRGRVFKYVGDPKRAGPREREPSAPKTAAPPTAQRIPPQDARTASAAAPKSASPSERGGTSVGDSPAPAVITSQSGAATPSSPKGSAAGNVAMPQFRPADAEPCETPPRSEGGVAESTPGQAGISSDRATGMGAGSPLKAPSDHISQPGKKVRVEPIDLLTELAILSAALLAAEVRSAAIYLTAPALERALRNFERADKLREEAKAGRG